MVILGSYKEFDANKFENLGELERFICANLYLIKKLNLELKKSSRNENSRTQ